MLLFSCVLLVFKGCESVFIVCRLLCCRLSEIFRLNWQGTNRLLSEDFTAAGTFAEYGFVGRLLAEVELYGTVVHFGILVSQ